MAIGIMDLPAIVPAIVPQVTYAGLLVFGPYSESGRPSHHGHEHAVLTKEMSRAGAESVADAGRVRLGPRQSGGGGGARGPRAGPGEAT
jgi:hypothetical protein